MEHLPSNPNVFQGFFRGLRRRRAFKVFLAILRRSLLLIVVLLFAFYLLLQLKPVQNWLVGKATDRLSQQLQTDVSLEEIDFKFFNNLVLKNFFIADLEGDTLLFAEELRTSMSANLIGLASSSFDLDEIDLRGATINLNINPYEKQSNLQKLLANLAVTPQDSSAQSKPVVLDLQKLKFQDITLNNTNQARGFYQFFTLPEGELTVNSIDLLNQEVILENIIIKNPDVTLELHPGKDTLIISEEEDITQLSEAVEAIVPHLTFEKLELTDGKFTFHNIRKDPVKSTPDSIIDYRHLFVQDIDIELRDFDTNGKLFKTELVSMALKERSGFQLNSMKSKEVLIDGRAAKFHDMSIETPYSSMGDTMIFKYRKFTDIDYFTDRVRMDVRIKNSKVAFRDIMSFAPGLKSNAFFQKNKNEQVQIEGGLTGRVNNLRGKNLKLRLDDGTNLVGNFRSRNLTLKEEEVLNLELDHFESDMQTLRLLLPNFNPPQNFDKLGKLNFNGRFDGFFLDFVAFGALETDLGNAEVDMRMDLTGGRQEANYSGKLSLDQFDLGIWSENPDLGIVSFQSEVDDGFGLTLDNVNTALSANIDKFDFKGYEYRNVEVEGRISKNLFDGDLQFNDENVDLTFSGAIQFGDSIPVFDFASKVNKLDLKAVNLSKRDLFFRGNLDLNLVDRDIAKIRGTANGSNLIFIEQGVDTFVLDSINLNTSLLANGDRQLSFTSEILNAEINGEYVLDQIPEAFLQYLAENFSQFSNRLNIKPKSDFPINANFSYNVTVPDSKNFLKLLDPKLGRVREASFNGKFDTRGSILTTNLDVPSFQYDNLIFDQIIVSIDGDEKGNHVYLEVEESLLNNLKLEPITLRGDIHKDTLEFQINALSWTSILDNLQLKGIFTVNEDFFNIQLLPQDLALFRESWRIGEDNYIRFDKEFLDIQNVLLTNEDRSIELSSYNNKGLNAIVTNFDFSIIDDYWDYQQLDFAGKFAVTARVEDVFKQEGLRLNVSADTLLVNGEDWGIFSLDAQAPTIRDEAFTYLSITRSDGQLTAEGKIIPPNLRTGQLNPTVPGLDFNLIVNGFPLHIAEYWLSNGISNTKGQFDLSVKLNGPVNKINSNGDIRIYNGAVTIDILNTRYFIDDQKAIVTNTLFDVTGATVKDELDNQALLKGGITHNHLRKLGLDVSMRSSNFLALNTSKKDNDVFYGYAMSNGTVTFTGSFQKPYINIDATPMPGTNIIIPITEEQDASEVSFIDFIQKEDSVKIEGPEEILGVEMDMTIAMNDNALMELIFDEKTGDIIKGRGDGLVQLHMGRNGAFEMDGNYRISSGQYLFTALGFINKPFEVKEGGTIRWSGDPYNADINIDADYLGVNASVYNFISEYPDLDTKDQLKNEARQSTPVSLSMNLSGQLLKPDILFNLDFPTLTGELKNYVDNKLFNIRQNPNELNRQVFGLITFGSFIPSNQGILAGNNAVKIGINTLSEFLTSQLSNFLNDFFADIVKESKFITSIELDLGYDRFEGQDLVAYNNFGVRPKIYFADGKGSVEGGAGVNFGERTSTYFGGDLVIEWSISKDRRVKIKGFGLWDQNFFGSRNQLGAGITYRREGDSFKQLFSRKSKEEAKK